MKIAIVGGGASGLAAAISSARAGSTVTLFESGERVGKKILMTGNGKCNLSNANISVDGYYSDDEKFLSGVLDRFGTMDAVNFFRSLGLFVTEKRGGLYPYSEQASCVLDSLRYEIERLGVELISSTKITDIKKDNSQYCLVSEENERYKGFDKIIIATGSKAAPKTGSDGNGYLLVKKLRHSVTPIVPALIGLKCQGDFWKSISGVRAFGKVSIVVNDEEVGFDKGEIQFADYGISGIPVFQVSRIAGFFLNNGAKVEAVIDLIPDMHIDDLTAELKARLLLVPEKDVESFFSGLLNKKLATLLIKKLGLKTTDLVNSLIIERFAALAKAFRVKVLEPNSYEQAQTCAGGVPTSEIFDDFESKLNKGIYIIGELLNIDGICGGYNLHFAWASGIIAGMAASGKVKDA